MLTSSAGLEKEHPCWKKQRVAERRNSSARSPDQKHSQIQKAWPLELTRPVEKRIENGRFWESDWVIRIRGRGKNHKAMQLGIKTHGPCAGDAESEVGLRPPADKGQAFLLVFGGCLFVRALLCISKRRAVNSQVKLLT